MMQDSIREEALASVPSHPGAGLPARAGLGLKPMHFQDVLRTRPDIGFFEVHAENYMVAGGPFHAVLARIREQYPLSIHGVGMSIGSEAGLDLDHLARLVTLLGRYAPASFSEHLAWSSHGGAFFNDLLPVAYDGATLQRVCEHVDAIQCALGRRILIENPATYVEFRHSALDEAGFLAELVRRTDCGLLLDVTNAYISAVNHHRDIDAWLHRLPLRAVAEIHLAGFNEDRDAAGDRLLIDTHGSAIDDAVWSLYERCLALTGPVPTLIERDNDVPPLASLIDEVERADRTLLGACGTRSGARSGEGGDTCTTRDTRDTRDTRSEREGSAE